MSDMVHQILIQRIQEAIKLANISVMLGSLAVLCFCVFGTLAAMASFKDSLVVYYAFHYLPYLLIGLSAPISLYHLFLLNRYRIIQKGILAMILLIGIGMVGVCLGQLLVTGVNVNFFMSVFLTVIVWFGMPFLFRVNFKKFLNFLQTEDTLK